MYIFNYGKSKFDGYHCDKQRARKKNIFFKSVTYFFLVFFVFWPAIYGIIFAEGKKTKNLVEDFQINKKTLHGNKQTNIFVTRQTNKNVDDFGHNNLNVNSERHKDVKRSISKEEAYNHSNENINEEELFDSLPTLQRTIDEDYYSNKKCNFHRKKKLVRFLQMLDPKTDPCEDFYRFSCGGLSNSNILENEEDVQIELLLKLYYTNDKAFLHSSNFKKFFRSCIMHDDELEDKKIHQALTSNNGSTENLTELLLFLMLRQSTPLFEIRYGPISQNENYGFQILPPATNYHTVGLQDWSLQYHLDKDCYDFVPELKYSQKINLTSVYEDFGNCRGNELIKKMEEFEKAKGSQIENIGSKFFYLYYWNQISNLDIENALVHQKYTKTSVKELQNKYSHIDWNQLFNGITNGNFNSSRPIFVYLNNEYFQPLMESLDKMLLTKNQVIEGLKTYYHLELYGNLLKKTPNREQYCMKQSIILMPEIANKIFAEYYKPLNNYAKVLEETFENLKERYAYFIDDSFFEEKYKKLFKHKLKYLKIQNFINNYNSMNLVKDSLVKYMSQDYLSNVYIFMEYLRKKLNSLETMDALFLHLTEDPFRTTPKFVKYTNTIAVPTAFLYRIKELKSDGYPNYVIQTYIQFHLGRSIALYLDEIANNSKFYNEFLNALDELIITEDSYNKLLLFDQNITLEKNYHWKEVVQFSTATRLADRLALEIAFSNIFNKNIENDLLPCLSDELSAKKQFFALVAQEYCEKPTIPQLAQSLYETSEIPSIYRIREMLMNSKNFAETFSCKLGSSMYPDPIENFTRLDPQN